MKEIIPILKPGQLATVYQKPVTSEDKEGVCTLRRFAGIQEDHWINGKMRTLEYWVVKMGDDIVSRFVSLDDVHRC